MATKRKSSTLEGRFSNLLIQARRRNISVSLTLDQYKALMKDLTCHYCDEQIHTTGSGLDRKDNDKGYDYDNVVTCCKHCNERKSNWLTYEEYKQVIEIIKKNRGTDKVTLKNRY